MTTASTSNIRLDTEVVAALKVMAARRKTTIKALVTQALFDSFGRLPEVRAVRGPRNQVTR